MRTREFREWLATEYLQRNGKPLAPGTQVSRAANCATIEQHEGDLDRHFRRDGLSDLLRRLSFASAERRTGQAPRHAIPIAGDAVNGSATYRSALQLYRKFRVGTLGATRRVAAQPELDEALAAALAAMPATERDALVQSRVGQGRFRSLVLEIWDYRCAVTKCGALLGASHIKPWRLATNHERLDGWNGLALSPAFDRAFDAGFITFEDDASIRLSPQLPKAEFARLGILPALRLEGLRSRHLPYLAWHREAVFRRGCGRAARGSA